MSAPLIWIGLPLLGAAAASVFHRQVRWVRLGGFLTALGLALLAARLPVGETIALRLWTGFPALVVRETVALFGVRLTIGASLQPVIALVYGAAAFWFGGAFLTRQSPFFIPGALGFCALTTLALAIDPPLYAPFILLIAALGLLPLFSPPGKPIQSGVRRFLTYQVLGTGLVLLANWVILNASLQLELEVDPLPPILMLWLGIGLILPVFPFHTWIPMISAASEPYSVSFFFFLLPAANAWLALENLVRVGATLEEFYAAVLLRLAAALMILFAGMSALFEDNLRRILGFGLTYQVGVVLLVMSLYPTNMTLFFSALIAWGAGLALWALCLNLACAGAPKTQLTDLRGLARRAPLLSAGLLAGIFSTAGLPLLAGFPVHLSLFAAVAGQTHALAWIAWLGSALLAEAGVRALAQMAAPGSEPGWRVSENTAQIILITAGLLLILGLGIFPNLILVRWTDLADLARTPFP